jgi:hypothetical protein
MKFIKGKMDIQRAPNAMKREKGVDVMALMNGKKNSIVPLALIKAPQAALGRVDL